MKITKREGGVGVYKAVRGKQKISWGVDTRRCSLGSCSVGEQCELYFLISLLLFSLLAFICVSVCHAGILCPFLSWANRLRSWNKLAVNPSHIPAPYKKTGSELQSIVHWPTCWSCGPLRFPPADRALSLPRTWSRLAAWLHSSFVPGQIFGPLLAAW